MPKNKRINTKTLAEDQNKSSQPLQVHPVFNRWDVVVEGWYVVCRSKDIGINRVKSFDVCGQHICIFRNSKSVVTAMDGFCPHMGVDLGIGKVVNDRVQCFFHHWEFDANGLCQFIPAGEDPPKKVCLTTYQVEEKYGLIWVHPNLNTEYSVPEVPDLEGKNTLYSHGKIYERRCHHHITMINGIDPQHLSTVHNINITMDINVKQAHSNMIDIELSGIIPDVRFSERIAKKLLGDRYAYSMKYIDGCIGILTIMKNVRFLGKYHILPPLHILFAYQLIERGRTQVRPIFITKKRPGLLGYLKSRCLILLSKLAFYSLKGEDGEVYDNIRFSTHHLLPMDAPIGKYIQYINRLKPSIWSKV